MRDCFLPALEYNYMYYTLLFLTGLFFSGIASGAGAGTWAFSQPAMAQTQADEPSHHCSLTLNQRLELQIAEYSWQTLLNRPLPLWPGFAPQAVPLKLKDANCTWLLTISEPPAQSRSLPDFKRVF